MLGIVGPLLSHIGVATINHDLHTPILCKHQGHICLLTADELFSLPWGVHRLRDDKIFRLCQSFYGLLCAR